MSLKHVLVAGLLAGVSTGAAAEVMPLAEAAKRFGMRESAWQADLSPSGRKIVYLAPGAGPQTIAKVLDLDTNKTVNLIGSDGKPDKLDWCEFATETQLICRYSGNGNYDGVLVGFSRLATLSLTGSEVKSLASRQSSSDLYLRQNDGAVLDWLPDEEGSVLMARTYVPKVLNSASNIKNDRHGLGVDKVDLSTMKSKAVEPARKEASRYMTDGRGVVRIMGLAQTDGAGQLTGRTLYRYRRSAGSDWETLGEHQTQTDAGIWPLAIEN
ncbi:MAG TPA: hypothetical protein VFR36_00935, partial [Sphingomicrobium sp.]|nr:hypothetical protein [Sphingomicrobium sp.]